MADTESKAPPENKQEDQDDDIYTQVDQSLFDFATEAPDRLAKKREAEKAALAKQQRNVMTIVGAVVALALVIGIGAIVMSSVGGN